MNLLYRPFLLACICTTPKYVEAAYIVYHFEGTFEKQAFAGPVVPLGAPFTGLFSFNEQGSRVDEPFNGGMRSHYSPIFVELTVGNETISSTGGSARVQDAQTIFSDSFSLLAGSEVGAPFNGTLNGNSIRAFQVFLGGFRETFSSADYPTTLAIADFDSANINMLSGALGNQTLSSSSHRGGIENLLQFTVSSGMICDTPTCQIPEPSAIALALASAAALVAARRRQRARPQSSTRFQEA